MQVLGGLLQKCWRCCLADWRFFVDLVSISVSTHSYCGAASITYPKAPNPVDEPEVAVLLVLNSPPPLVVVVVPNALRLAPKGDEFVVVAPKPSRIIQLVMVLILKRQDW